MPLSVRTLLGRPSAYLPLAMSLAAIALVVGVVVTHGIVRSEDEGAAARLFQLLLLAQVPFVAWFAAKALPRAPRPAALVMALQALGWVSAIGLVVLLER